MLCVFRWLSVSFPSLLAPSGGDENPSPHTVQMARLGASLMWSLVYNSQKAAHLVKDKVPLEGVRRFCARVRRGQPGLVRLGFAVDALSSHSALPKDTQRLAETLSGLLCLLGDRDL